MSAKLWAGLAVVVVVATVAAVTGWTLLAAREDLLSGRAALQRAADAVAERDLEAAADALDTAQRSLGRGARRLSSPAAWPARAAPVAGRNVAAARALADAGADASHAGADLLGDLRSLPQGLATFAPADGRLPIAALARVGEPLAEARAALAAAEASAAGAPRDLVGPLARARDRLVARLSTVSEGVDAAAALARQLPGFLGGQETRRYLVGAQNPAELRGTGGLIGAISVLTVDEGRVQLSDFRSVGTLTRNAPASLPPPSPAYAARYARYGAITHGSNINMTPSVPTAAAALERLYTAVEGQPVDGTILADPVFFEALVRLTGPVTVPGVGELAADEVVAFATREQYALLTDRPDRKELLGDVAESALGAFLDGAGDPGRALTVLGEAVRAGRLQIHADAPAEQAAFAAAGMTGSLGEARGDYLAVIGNNAAGHKGDPFYERDLTYTVALRADGSADATLTMELANHSPTEGLNDTVLGTNLSAPGDNRTIWSAYCAARCRVEALRRDGDDAPVSVQRELGRTVTTATTRLSSGEATTLQWQWRLPRAWRPAAGDRLAGRYELTIDDQPHLMDTSLSVRVRPPPGAVLRPAPGSPLTATAAGGARFDGRIGDRRRLAARIAPAPPSAAEQARRVLNQPLAELAR